MPVKWVYLVMLFLFIILSLVFSCPLLLRWRTVVDFLWLCRGYSWKAGRVNTDSQTKSSWRITHSILGLSFVSVSIWDTELVSVWSSGAPFSADSPSFTSSQSSSLSAPVSSPAPPGVSASMGSVGGKKRLRNQVRSKIAVERELTATSHYRRQHLFAQMYRR